MVPREDLRFNFRPEDNHDKAGGVRRRLVLNLIAAAVMLYTIFFLVSIVRSASDGVHIPNEYREAANFDLTLSFIKGINPYTLGTLDNNVPACAYQYGPLFSLLVAGLHFVLPFVDIFALHYIFAFICMMAASIMAAIIAHENTKTLLPPVCAFLFITACSWRYGYVNAVPDTLGLTLLVMIFFAETRKKLPGKEYIEAFIAVALFYTKQYFVIVAASLFIYKLITDKKACLKLSISGIVFLVSSVALIDLTCPLYFTYSLLVVHGVSGQSVAKPVLTGGQLSGAFIASAKNIGPIYETASAAGNPSTGWAFEVMQLKSLVGIFVFVFLSMAAGVVLAFIKRRPSFNASRLFVIHSAVAFAALLFLGQNDGAWLSYYLQLLMPSVIIYAFIIAETCVLDESVTKIWRIAAGVLLILMVMHTTYRVDSRLPYYIKSSEVRQSWEKAYKYCDAYAGSGEILYRAPVGVNALMNGRYLYDNGHELAIKKSFLDEYNNSPAYQSLFPYAGRLMEQHEAYRKEMLDKAGRQEYSLIMIADGETKPDEMITSEDAEAAGYVLLEEIPLDMGWASYDVEFWVRSSEDIPVLEAVDSL